MAEVAHGELSMLVSPASAEHPRQSEASILAFEDGRLLLAYSDFYAGDWRDEGPACIRGRWSPDAGASWSEPFVVQENIGRLNCMSASLLRLPSGRVLLAFGRKDVQPVLMDAMVKYSDDEGRTWSDPRPMTRGERYWGMTNDRLLRTASGRLVYPVYTDDTSCRCCLSDDDGATWRTGGEVAAPDGVRYVEPMVAELPGGGLAMYIRTTMGNMHVALSDDGEAWRMHKDHAPDMCGHPDAGPNAAYAPCMVKRVPGTDDLLLIWNNNRVRTPLTAAVSHDGGETWRHLRNLEEMDGWPPRLTHAYPSLAFLGDDVHVTYWEAEGRGGPEERIGLRYRRLPRVWFYAGE